MGKVPWLFSPRQHGAERGVEMSARTTIPSPPGPAPSFANSASFVRRYKTVPPVSAVGGAFTEEALRMQQLSVWRAGEKALRERKASADRAMVEQATASLGAQRERQREMLRRSVHDAGVVLASGHHFKWR